MNPHHPHRRHPQANQGLASSTLSINQSAGGNPIPSQALKPDDGLLALDKNGNGKIDNHRELFGTATTDGFSVLRALDSNKDGKITAADTQYANLRIWRDLNQDGASHPGELFSPAALKVTSINLNATTVNYTLAGNQVTHESSFVMNGITRKLVDVWFNFDDVNTVYQGNYTLNPETLFLPQLRGYGSLPDLHIAMSQKPALLTLVKQLTTMDIMGNPAAVMPLVQKIMHYWADVQALDPANIHGEGDMRDIAFLEKLFNRPAGDEPGGFVGAARIPLYEEIFRDVQTHLAARLLMQGPGQQLFCYSAAL